MIAPRLNRLTAVLTGTAALAAVLAVPVQAQQSRLSLGERVSALEQQMQGTGDSQNTVELLNRINQMQEELANLRNLVEQQAFELESLKKRQRDQYLDLDSRLQRIEGSGPSAPARPEGAPLALVDEVELAPPAAGQLSMGEPQPTDPQSGSAAPGFDAPPEAIYADPNDPAALAAQQAAYDRAFEALKQGRYDASARYFAGFLSEFPNAELAPNATYWLGESYYVTRNYRIALDSFQQLLARYPDSGKAPDALLKVGYCHFELGDVGLAEQTLEAVINRYPDSAVARLAEGRLRGMRLNSNR